MENKIKSNAMALRANNYTDTDNGADNGAEGAVVGRGPALLWTASNWLFNAD